MSWTSSDRLMYIQFTSCVYGDKSSLSKVSFPQESKTLLQPSSTDSREHRLFESYHDNCNSLFVDFLFRVFGLSFFQHTHSYKFNESSG